MPTVSSAIRDQAILSTNREKLDFSEEISLLDPNANPKTYIFQKLGSIGTGNIIHRWFEDELQPETDQVNYGTGYSSSATSIVVDDGDKFAAGDLVMHNQTREVMLVTAVTTDTLTVDRDYGQGSTPGYTARADTIDNNDYLTILSNAFEQGHPLPAAKSTVEVERYNVCQDVRTPISITDIAANSAMHGAQDLPWQLKKAGITHTRKLERMNTWGVPDIGDKGAYVAATTNTHPATAGGIWWYMDAYASSSRKVSQAEITQAEFMSWLEAAFEYGSSEKTLFCPPLLNSAFDSWGMSKGQTFMGDTVMGMKIRRWESSHGLVNIVIDKMLKEPSTDGSFAFLLDMENIKWAYFNKIGMTQLNEIDMYKAGGYTRIDYEYRTISCIEFKQPETHAVLKDMTSYAA